jgi:tRNA(fMet)-specific endonuclease VapC
MGYLLDTNVAIALRDHDSRIIDSVAELGEDLSLSIISRIELENGVCKDAALTAVRKRRVMEIYATLEMLPFDSRCADAYESILMACGYSRRKLLDRMIAAQALVHELTLVTLNGKDFIDIPNLKLLAC